MEKIYSIEERVVLIVKEFMDDIDSKEPFNLEVSQYRFKLRSKLIELLNQLATDTQTMNTSFNSALMGMERYLEDRINRINLDSEKELRRIISALEETNEVLKEFLYKDSIKDKSYLSKLSGKIGYWIERLNLELKRRFGGFFRRIKRIFGK